MVFNAVAVMLILASEYFAGVFINLGFSFFYSYLLVIVLGIALLAVVDFFSPVKKYSP